MKKNEAYGAKKNSRTIVRPPILLYYKDKKKTKNQQLFFFKLKKTEILTQNTEIVTKLKNKKWWQNLKNKLIVIKPDNVFFATFNNSLCDKTQELKLWQNWKINKLQTKLCLGPSQLHPSLTAWQCFCLGKARPGKQEKAVEDT